jgi:hypothetical protein
MKKRLVIILTGIILIAVSCEKVDNGACGKGKFSEFYVMMSPWQYQYEKFTGIINKNIIYYDYPVSGKVQFLIAYKQENICPDKHIEIAFEVDLKSSGELINKLPFRVFGEAYWSLFYQNEEVQLFNGIEVPKYYFRSGTSIGLKQVFDSNKGFVNLFLTVEFDKQGSFSQDSTLFVNSIEKLVIQCNGDKFE